MATITHNRPINLPDDPAHPEMLNPSDWNAEHALVYPFQLGGEAGYTEIQEDGSMIMVDGATTFDDALGSLIGLRMESPSSDIIINLAECGVDFKTSSRYPTDYVIIPTQLTHRWKAGSSLHPHLHWEQDTANVPNWLIAYRWQVNGAAKVTAWTNQKLVSSVFTYTTGTLNQISSFGTIDPPVGYEISDIVQIRLYRDYTNASTLFTGTDPRNATVMATFFDAHVETDRLGSRTEYAR